MKILSGYQPPTEARYVSMGRACIFRHLLRHCRAASACSTRSRWIFLLFASWKITF
jgi:hypothetical protein